MIAIFHTSNIHNTYQMNFEMIYQCYNKAAQKASGKLPQVDRLLAMKAFQNLEVSLLCQQLNSCMNHLSQNVSLFTETRLHKTITQ